VVALIAPVVPVAAFVTVCPAWATVVDTVVVTGAATDWTLELAVFVT
jgi:hypothetical protein